MFLDVHEPFRRVTGEGLFHNYWTCIVKFVHAPLHVRVANDLRRRIAAGELGVGSPLPSEAELGAQWHGSRGPIRQALATLRAEGLIGGGRGKPPVVRRRSLGQSFDTFVSFSSWADSLGLPPGQGTIELARRPASIEIADALHLDEGEPVVQLLRVRSVADQPTMLERTTFVAQFGRALFDFDTDSGSIYAYLSGLGLAIGGARHVIDAVGADAADGALLGVQPGSPLLRQRRVAYTTGGEAFEYSDDRYRSDLVAITIENQPEGQPALGRHWSDLAVDRFPFSASH